MDPFAQGRLRKFKTVKFGSGDASQHDPSPSQQQKEVAFPRELPPISPLSQVQPPTPQTSTRGPWPQLCEPLKFTRFTQVTVTQQGVYFRLTQNSPSPDPPAPLPLAHPAFSRPATDAPRRHAAARFPAKGKAFHALQPTPAKQLQQSVALNVGPHSQLAVAPPEPVPPAAPPVPRTRRPGRARPHRPLREGKSAQTARFHR